MVNDFKECSCLGRNPHCSKCNGFGMIRSQDTVSIPLTKGKIVRPKKKKNSSIKCPYCNNLVGKLNKHLKKVHPEEVSGSNTTNEYISKTFKENGNEPPPITKGTEKYRQNKKSSPARSEEKIAKREVKKNKPTRQKSRKILSNPIIDEKLGSYEEVLSKLGIEPKSSSPVKEDSSQNRNLNQPKIRKKELDGDVLSKSSFLYCTICGAKVREDLYENHCRKRHSKKKLKNVSQSRKSTTSGRRYIVRTETDQKSDSRKNTSNPKSYLKKDIYLKSKRGKRYEEIMTCSACGMPTTPTWSYLDDDDEDVLICARCKPKVFERSFGRKDAMDIAVQGGMFDGNRRRH